MDFEQIKAKLQSKKLAGICYEKEGHGKFRDCLTIASNGSFLFERYCYGEAASKVCTMKGQKATEAGSIQWDYTSCPYSGKTEAPVQLTKIEGEKLYFDKKWQAWLPQAELKTVPLLGLTKLRMLFGGK